MDFYNFDGIDLAWQFPKTKPFQPTQSTQPSKPVGKLSKYLFNFLFHTVMIKNTFSHNVIYVLVKNYQLKNG